MPFQIHPIREFLVRPALPPAIARLSELAYNILWSWEPVIRSAFRRLDPALWRECGYNPVLMLGRISQSALEKAAADTRYLSHYSQACQRFDSHMQRVPQAPGQHAGKLIAYFSAEYGMTECLPIYSGGLGILSGDHLKSASDLDLPLVGVGLLYQQGYFRQYLNPDGWQQERYPTNDFYTLPITRAQVAGEDIKVTVKLPEGPVVCQVWQIQVGRTRLLLLDTNISDNVRPEDRDITDTLYGGDTDTRIRQEIVLGIGGLRALQALGLEPTVYHMNEGHSAFLAVERINLLMKAQGMTFDEALQATRVSNVFTTHTPVPAGIDLFDPGLMYHYFHDFCRESGIDFDTQLMALGRQNPYDRGERFSMAVLALNTSAHRNAVSRLHREVSQEMWNHLWPELPTWEVPITSVTNGVHLPSWVNGDLAQLYDQYLAPDWRESHAELSVWDGVKEIPDEELLEMHRRRKRRLIAFVRTRASASAARRQASGTELRHSNEVLDPNALTIGFARRFATYKRATLLFKDRERLKRILLNPERPVQIVIAGKAHPKDHPGKAFIREIVQLSRDADLWKHVVFLEDYDMKVGRELVQGVDLWLNNPKRGEEACGTSGMKAAMNGVLNLSILDGWWDEAYEYSGGWAIGERENYSEEQDMLHASEIYHLLENEIVPAFYENRGGVPREWMRRVKQCVQNISPRFDCRRMVREYDTELYETAHRDHVAMAAGKFGLARDRARWDAKVRMAWDRVNFVDLGPAPAGPVLTGRPVAVRAALDLAGLAPDDVRVEVVVGRVGNSGNLEDTEVLVLPPVETTSTHVVFAKEILPERTGRLGYAVRVSPNHCEDPLTRPCSALLKWSQVR